MNNSQKWALGICMFVSIASVIFSIIALCNSNEKILGVDYSGIIGGVLSATVTVLIGWQIYVLVDLRGTQNEYKELKDSLEKEIYTRIADLYSDFASIYGGKGDFFFRTCYVLRRIIFLSKAGEYKKCDDEIETLLFFSIDHVLEEYKHTTVYFLLDQIENASKISKMGDLRSFIRKHYRLDEEDARKNKAVKEMIAAFGKEDKQNGKKKGKKK